MQSLKVRSIFNKATINHNLINCRNVTMKSAAQDFTGELKSWKDIPGPSSLPVIGQIHHFLPGGSLYNKLGNELSKILYDTYGPIVRLDPVLGGPGFLMMYDAKYFEQILRSENWLPVRIAFPSLDYYRLHYKNSEKNSQQVAGLLTDQGEVWKEFRSKVNPVLMQPKTIKLYNTALDEVAEDMIVRMRSIRDNNNVLSGNFDEEMNLWALESIGVVALGTRLNCFDPNLPQDSPARRLIKNVHDIFKICSDLDFKPSLWRFISTPTFKRAMKLYEEQVNISKYFIKKAVNKLATAEKKSDDEKGALEKLLEIDEEVAHIMASDMLIAGVDTVANTMTATLYLLAKNQEKQNKLREEVTSISDNDKRPYLTACIKEAMRMMPITTGNIRQTTKEYNILGYRIPKGILTAFNHQYLCLMEEHYTRPQEFIPERWICHKDDPLHYGKTHPFVYNPFGFGVRSCVGRRIAELELRVFLTKIIQNFKVEWRGPPPKVLPQSLNYIIGPFEFRFIDVK